MYGSGSFQNIILLPKPQEVYCSPMSLLQPLNLLGLCSMDTQIIGLKVVYAYCCFFTALLLRENHDFPSNGFQTKTSFLFETS